MGFVIKRRTDYIVIYFNCTNLNFVHFARLFRGMLSSANIHPRTSPSVMTAPCTFLVFPQGQFFARNESFHLCFIRLDHTGKIISEIIISG